jgi:tetratricopeptide (TPR) repeat protein
MPHRDSRNIAHVTQTDHRILRREENAQSPEPTEAGSDSTRIQLRFLDPQDKQLPKWEQSRAMGVGMFSYLARKGQPAPTGLADLLAPALRENPDDGLVLATLGALALQHQQSEMAEQFFDKARHDPGSRESSLMGLLELRYQSGQWDEALTLADQCLANDPGHPGLHAIRADVLLKLGRTQDAIAAGRTSIALDPSVTSVREWLLTVYQKESDSRSASELAAEIARIKSARSKGAVK